MNTRIKGVFVLINNKQIVYADTNMTSFLRNIKRFIPNLESRLTFQKKIETENVLYYRNNLGESFEVYHYNNPNYKG